MTVTIYGSDEYLDTRGVNEIETLEVLQSVTDAVIDEMKGLNVVEGIQCDHDIFRLRTEELSPQEEKKL